MNASGEKPDLWLFSTEFDVTREKGPIRTILEDFDRDAEDVMTTKSPNCYESAKR